MKRTPLARGKALARKTWLSRTGKPLKRKTAIRGGQMTEIPEGIRRAVCDRSGGSCEVCHVARADHIHHKLMRSQGGRHEIGNLLHVCAGCHDRIHRHPAESYERGHLIRSGVTA